MGLLHSAFLFDYERFLQETSDLRCELDKGNFRPLYERVEQITKGMNAEEWILHLEGTTLSKSIIENKPLLESNQPDVGHCLLIVLSTYLLKRCPSLDGNWGVLQTALQRVGWSGIDARLLVQGMPIEKLLKPDIGLAQRGHRKVTEPYWRWVIPTQAYASGWLSIEEIQRLRSRLQKTAQRLERFDVTDYPGIDATNPTVIREYSRYLQTAYEDVLALLVMAERANVGTFAVIS